ncbi:unnamed protein product [Ascophyllum nodosum]
MSVEDPISGRTYSYSHSHGVSTGKARLTIDMCNHGLGPRYCRQAGKAGADSLQSTSTGESNVQAPKESERQVEYEEGQHLEESADNAAFDVDWVNELNGIPDPTNDGSTTSSFEDLENSIDVVNEEKELAIYENDDPTDAVLAFCAKNMPDEVADCVDDVLASVQDTLTVTTEDVKVIAE